MRCSKCGAHIPDGMLICPDCGTEVQIVPDYNPLDDVLVREVRGSVRDATRPIKSDDLRRYRRDESRRAGTSTRVLNSDELDRIRSRYSDHPNHRYNTAEQRKRSTGYQDTGAVRRREAEEKKRQQMLRKKKQRQRRIKYVCAFLIFVLAVAGICGLMLYRNSYEGIVKKGYESLQMSEYSAAIKYFNKAINKDPQKPEAYTGMAEVYIEQKNLDNAENVFLNAIDSQPENVALYEAAVEFYVETEQLDKISSLLEGCTDTVLEAMSDYVAEAPEFSLDEGTYTEVQEVSLTADGDIYYTIDGAEPTSKSTLYEEPILINEGTVIIKAICVNEKGISSLSSSRTYTVDIPIADAPAVTPSTGQYSAATQIVIDVPDGYTAYYTTDGTTPTAASTLYTGPIDMPEGQTTFSAVLLSKSGKLTPVTKRSYLLEY